jgi:hypothetical protein
MLKGFDCPEENKNGGVTIKYNGREKPPKLNDIVALRMQKRIRLFLCKTPGCGGVVRKTFEIADSFRGPELCPLCKKPLSQENKIGDSHYPDEFPNVAWAIEGYNRNNEPNIVAYLMTECAGCHEMHYIPWRNNRLVYDECECQWRELLQEQADYLRKLDEKRNAPVVVPAAPAPMELVDFSTKIPKPLADRAGRYMLVNDKKRDELIVNAIEQLLDKEEFH